MFVGERIPIVRVHTGIADTLQSYLSDFFVSAYTHYQTNLNMVHHVWQFGIQLAMKLA